MTMPETAELLRMSVRWLQQQVTDGKAPIVHAGRSVRMRRSDVEAFARDGQWPKPDPPQDTRSPLVVVVAGTHAEYRDFCIERSLGVRAVFARDAHCLKGLNLHPDTGAVVHFVGTWRARADVGNIVEQLRIYRCPIPPPGPDEAPPIGKDVKKSGAGKAGQRPCHRSGN
jgi:excisionase family DNA binding protein